jgi:hypothetical protein
MKNLNHIGINNEYLPVNLFNKLKEEINLSKGKIGVQDKLIGNIKEEWDLTKSIPIFNSYILSLINKHESHLNFLSKEKDKFISEQKTPFLNLTHLWVNFQKKYEFNPIHTHRGLFSFIIFVQIPYDINQELKEGPGHLSNKNVTSCLQFYATDTLGRPYIETVCVDKSYEGGIYFFNALTNHCVYPFFTSDDYRITVSGNIKWIC